MCSLEDCEAPAESRGWCSKHYTRWLRHGTTEPKRSRQWVASNGYVRAYSTGHPTADADGKVCVHRAILFDSIGGGAHPCHWCDRPVTWFTRSWATELVADHLNGNRLDNRATNLVPACNRCNTQRSRSSVPTCRKGHPFPSEPQTRNGVRVCPTCLAARREKEKLRKRAARAAAGARPRPNRRRELA
jgi:hypothetical protein